MNWGYFRRFGLTILILVLSNTSILYGAPETHVEKQENLGRSEAVTDDKETFIPNCEPKRAPANPVNPVFLSILHRRNGNRLTYGDCIGNWIGKKRLGEQSCEYVLFTAGHCTDAGALELIIEGRYSFDVEQHGLRVERAGNGVDAALVYVKSTCDLIPKDQIGTLGSSDSAGRPDINLNGEVLNLQTRKNGVIKGKVYAGPYAPGFIGSQVLKGYKQSQKGDSGSPVWTENNEIVGTHHGGAPGIADFVFSAGGSHWAQNQIKTWCGDDSQLKSAARSDFQDQAKNSPSSSDQPEGTRDANPPPGYPVANYDKIRGVNGDAFAQREDGTWDRVLWQNGKLFLEHGGKLAPKAESQLLNYYEESKNPQGDFGNRSSLVYEVLDRKGRSTANFNRGTNPIASSSPIPGASQSSNRRLASVEQARSTPRGTASTGVRPQESLAESAEFRSDYQMPASTQQSNTRNNFAHLLKEDAKRKNVCTQHRTFVPQEVVAKRPGEKVTDPSLLRSVGLCISCHSSGSGRKLILPQDPTAALWALRDAVKDRASPASFDSIYKMASSPVFGNLSDEEIGKLFGFLLGNPDQSKEDSIKAAVKKELGTASGANQQTVRDDWERFYRGLLRNATNNPFANALFEDADTFLFDKDAMPTEYQVAADKLGLGEGREVTTQSRSKDWKNIINSEGQFDGILGGPLGTPKDSGLSTFTFMRLPHDETGNQGKIGYGNMSYSSNGAPQSSYIDYWDFPIGTTFGEVLYAKDPTGEYYVAEIRTRRRMPGGSWQPDVYRRFPTSADLISQVKSSFPNWQSDSELKTLVTHLENKSRLKDSVVVDNYYAKVIQAVGAEDILPALSADKVKKLVNETPLRSTLGMAWDKADGKTSFAPTTHQAYHVAPSLKDVHAVAVTTESCTRCHSMTGMNVGLLRPNEMNSSIGSQTPESYFATWTANACPDGAPSFSVYQPGRGSSFTSNHRDTRRVGGANSPSAAPDFRQEFIKSGILAPLNAELSNPDRARFYQ